ncbi:arsenite methyltransferase [Zhaonella formicivorans]|uniref:arsenite methyltransferase n=1 Tax=Zhaonella formicivorans TaxID=2528593 RepID=UPI0010EE414C|nr:arsenite methyltransferase [Zhaonella formicivorans]
MDFEVKEKVKDFYGRIASIVSADSKGSCCCGSSCCDGITKTTEFYSAENLHELPVTAINASLGCSNPLSFAELKEGEIVLDLGCGGGIDVFLASKYVGDSGKVYGLDMTDEMLKLANDNKQKMGVQNVEFIKGYIEDIPLGDETVDVIMSNCVINLSEDKEKAMAEAYRVLKNGGRLAIADIVSLKEVPQEVRDMAEAWVGCIAGSLSVEEYTRILEKVGFQKVEIEPVNVYTKEVIEGLIEEKKELLGSMGIDLDLVDRAFAGAHIKAWK